jgi:type IV secretion system protein VirB6
MKTAQNLDAAIDGILKNFVTAKSAAICGILTPIAVAAMTIAFVFIGLSIARRQHSDPIKDTLWRLGRMSFIFFISLTAGTYQSFVVNGLNGIGETFIYAISGETSFAAQLDKMEEPFAKLGESIWSDATTGILPHAALLFAAAVVSLADSIIFSISIGFYLLAKMSVAIIMAVGPAFLLCAAWPATQKYAENWLGQALNFIFLKVLVTLTAMMLTSFASQFAAHMLAETDSINIIRAACALLINCIALTIVVLFHPQLASALFGGASVAGVGHMVMHMLLWAGQRTPSNKQPQARPNHIGNGSPSGPSSTIANSIKASRPIYQNLALSNLRFQQQRRAA